jgi:hypothetical protein
MQDTQVMEKAEVMEKESSDRNSKANSRFNDAEYERWSENIRKRAGSKNK